MGYSTVIYLSPELREHIASFCDRRSLAPLSRSNRGWAATGEPVLYRSVEIVISTDEATIRSSNALMLTLSTSPRKAHFVREMFVWYRAGIYSSSFDIMRSDIPLSQRLFEVLDHTPNLSDLRFQNDCSWFLPMAVCIGFLDAISSGMFQLRSLVAPFAFNRHASQLETALLSQQRTLRSLGVQLIEGRDTDPWRTYTHRSCTRLSFYLFGDMMSLTLAHPNPDRRTIDAVARSLPQVTVAGLDVVTKPGLPSRGIARLLAWHFPRVVVLSYQFDATAARIDRDYVLDAALPFVELPTLIMKGFQGNCERLSGDFHLATASALSEAGSRIKFILFPDGVRVQLEDGKWSMLARDS